MGTTIAFRVPDELATLLQQEVEQSGSTPSDILRAALQQYFAQKTRSPAVSREADLQQTIRFEEAKTRAVIMRYLDQKIGTVAADTLLDEADLDAQAYVEHLRTGG